MELKAIRTSGAALASLLQSVASCESADFDGLILGAHQLRSVSTMHDDREEETRDVLEARVTGFLCCASTCSFYTPAGRIDDGRLASLVAAAGETVLGWFVRRDKVSLVPSMRDRAVCAELPAALAELQPTSAEPRPLVWAVFRSCSDHNGASLSFEQRFFQQLPPAAAGEPARLVATPMAVANLGAAKGVRAYEPLAPVAGLPCVPRAPPVPCANGSHPASGGDDDARDAFVAVPEEQLRLVTGTDVQIQVKGVEAVYHTMLLAVEEQCAGLRASQAELDRLRRDIEAIP